MPSWRKVLDGDRRRRGRRSARRSSTARARIVARLQATAALEAPDADLDAAALDGAITALKRSYDAEYGGWGGAPKFPSASTIEFLLRRGERADGAAHAAPDGRRRHLRPDRRRLRALLGRRALDRPALREDALRQRAARARVPARVPGDAASRCSSASAARRSTGRCASCSQPEGGFASALDADSEGVEGKFYVWRVDEVRAALGPELADTAIAHFGMTEEGNFEGANIPVRATPDPERIDEIKATLLAAREQRVRPGLDDKRLTAWNALMISALADAGAALGEPRYRDAAVATAEFILRDLRADGRLLRTYNQRPRAPERLSRGSRVPARGAADAVRGDVRPALVRRGARARRPDPRPLRRPRARRLLLHGK